jgi:hypothetical protein
MDLPVMPPVAPMLAKPVAALPEGPFSFEPKWDGFRTIVFRDGDEVEMGSRNERPLTRYFPEVVEAVRVELPPRCVVDAEIVVPDPAGQGGIRTPNFALTVRRDLGNPAPHSGEPPLTRTEGSQCIQAVASRRATGRSQPRQNLFQPRWLSALHSAADRQYGQAEQDRPH